MLAPVVALALAVGPVWTDGSGRATPQARAVAALLSRAAEKGLDPADYGGARWLGEVVRLAGGRATRAEVAAFEAGLTASVRRYAAALRHGRTSPLALGIQLLPERNALDLGELVAELAAAPDPGAILAALEPTLPPYGRLLAAHARYRVLAEALGDATVVPAPRGPALAPGDPYPSAGALADRLLALGDLPAAEVTPARAGIYTRGLADGVARFQARHGLLPDGRLGRATVAALDVPLSRRVRQIELTLERWRWLPPFRARQIIVNIPQFRLFALESAEDRVGGTLQMPVIAGRAYRETRTPVFTADIEYVVFRPYWDVPRSIAVNEIVPLVRAKPGYLERNRMELVNGQADDSPVVEATPENLAALERGALRVRQRPGADNTLGLIKFVMPNGYGVYLHGTPGRRSFLLPRRDLSHGCIRVSDPAELAAYVLRGEPGGWTPQVIDAATRAEDARRVKLTAPVHVMLLYGTALATEDGRILFFEDLYGLDRRLGELLRRAAVTS